MKASRVLALDAAVRRYVIEDVDWAQSVGANALGARWTRDGRTRTEMSLPKATAKMGLGHGGMTSGGMPAILLEEGSQTL